MAVAVFPTRNSESYSCFRFLALCLKFLCKNLKSQWANAATPTRPKYQNPTFTIPLSSPLYISESLIVSGRPGLPQSHRLVGWEVYMRRRGRTWDTGILSLWWRGTWIRFSKNYASGVVMVRARTHIYLYMFPLRIDALWSHEPAGTVAGATPSILSFFVLFSSLSFCGYPLYWGETHSLSEPHLY
jgi:hypothetical protein